MGRKSWTAGTLDGGLPCPVFHRVGRVLRESEHGGGTGFGRRAAGRAAAATEMDSPGRLRLPEVRLRMIVDLLPHLGDRPIQAGCAWSFEASFGLQ